MPTIVGSFVFRFSIAEHLFFGVLPIKIQIRKLPTIVGSFRICVLHCKTHVFVTFCHLKLIYGNCLQLQAVSVFWFSIAKRLFFGVFQLKIQIRKLPTIVGSFRIRVLHCKTHVFWRFPLKIKIRKLPTIVGSFRIPVFHC